MKIADRLLNVPLTDPDDARRRKLLNILLIGMAAFVLLGLLTAIVVSITNGVIEPGIAALYQATLSTLIGIGIIFVINRYWSGWIASSLFLSLLITALAFSDEPRQIVEGRSTFLFTIPIMMASVILPPWASFILAGLSSAVIAMIVKIALPGVPPIPTMLGFFAVALVAWLSSRSLEQALQELRVINRELDQWVEERTHDLAQALSRNQAILDGIADGVIVFDNAAVPTMVNPAMTRILWKAPEAIVGRELDALLQEVKPDDREVIKELIRTTPGDVPSIKFEWGKKTLSATFAPVRDEVGRKTGTVGVFRDFTREAELERMKNIFISSVSHELRTPLNAILGYADMLKEAVYGPVSNGQRNVLDRIVVNARRLLTIVNDLLDQAQIEAGMLKIKIASFSPRDLVADVINTMNGLAQPKGLELTGEIATDVPDTLSGDRQRLHQILVNLVGNAIKFTDEGGVHVRVYQPDARHWAMEVSDTGPGIPPDAQPRIFEPFWQVDGSVTREHSGSGLGLSIVKQLTNLMGGEVTATSQMGEGSTFTVTMPLTPIQEEEKNERQSTRIGHRR